MIDKIKKMLTDALTSIIIILVFVQLRAFAVKQICFDKSSILDKPLKSATQRCLTGVTGFWSKMAVL